MTTSSDISTRSSSLITGAINASMLLIALAAPLSIAATQTAWALGLLFWIIRTFTAKTKPRIEKFDLALFAFVGLSFISSIFSYEPGTSLRKMVSVSLVTIVYLVSTNLKDTKLLNRMLVLLLAGTFIASAYAIGTQAVGKNLKVIRLSAESPIRAAGVEEGATILAANNFAITTPDDLVNALKATPSG